MLGRANAHRSVRQYSMYLMSMLVQIAPTTP